MKTLRHRTLYRALYLALTLGLISSALVAASLRAAEPTKPTTEQAPKGQRVYSIGHSFHMFMPGILAQLAKSAGINDHLQVGNSSIGGSLVIQHWDVADDKFKSKATLTSGDLDVLTMAPIYLPDEGIENFVRLASEKGPHIRVFVQEFWLPYDAYINFKDPATRGKIPMPNREVFDAEKLQADHDKYFHEIDEHVKMLNDKYKGKPAIFVAPVGQAVMALRKKIAAGAAPGISTQADLFTDPLGHVKPPVQVLSAYVYFALIYGRTPVGLPLPGSLRGVGDEETTAKLNTLLQELAWNAVTEHPLSGVKAK